jgi:hypothetical protein
VSLDTAISVSYLFREKLQETTMKRHALMGLCTAAMVIAAPTVATAQALPGTPLLGGFGTVDLTDGYTLLPGPVVAGDLVLLENPAGGTGSGNWSNVVRFFSLTATFGGATQNLNVAYLMSDGEAGIPSIQLRDILTGSTLLTNALAANQSFLQEVQSGTGTAADTTTYVPSLGTTYLVHSDAALPIESDEPVIVQPGTLIGGGGGGPKGFGSATFVEGGTETGSAHSVLNINLGPVSIVDGSGFDNFTFTANGVIGGTDVTIVSDPAEGSPDELERFTFMGDETFTSGFISSVDPIPEPETYVLMLAGLALMGAWVRRRR